MPISSMLDIDLDVIRLDGICTIYYAFIGRIAIVYKPAYLVINDRYCYFIM